MVEEKKGYQYDPGCEEGTTREHRDRGNEDRGRRGGLYLLKNGRY